MATPALILSALLLCVTFDPGDPSNRPRPGSSEGAALGKGCEAQEEDPCPEPQGAPAGQPDDTGIPAPPNTVGLFIAVAVGALTVMGVIYCIYNRFYSHRAYSHTQLQDDTELTLDMPDSAFYPASVVKMGGLQGYGSVSDLPSVISLPPSDAPLKPPSLPSLPPPHSSPLQISARDLEKTFL